MSCVDVVCGTGGGIGPLPGDPDNSVVLSANSVFGGIDVTWTYPVTNPQAIAYFILYRGLSNDFSLSVERGRISGNFFYDKIPVDTDTLYYYWIRWFSVQGTTGDTIGPAAALAKPTISELLVGLSGKIDKSALGQLLAADIEKIAGLGTSITEEIANRLADTAALGEVITDVNGKAVTAVTLIQQEVTQRKTADSATINSLTLMGVGYNNSIAGLAETIELKAGPNSALAKKVTTVEVAINGDVATGQIGLSAMLGDFKDEFGNPIPNGVAYTGKVKYNGLVGGFGVFNNGKYVSAGFDVDSFYIGRVTPSGANVTAKPFVVDTDGKVYMNDAVIKHVTIDKLTTGTGSALIDENGIIRSRGNGGFDTSWNGIVGTGKPESGATRNEARGDWAPNTAYLKGDIVLYLGSSYLCTIAHTSQVTPDETKFTLLSAKGLDGLPGKPGDPGKDGSFNPALKAVLSGSGGIVAGSMTWDGAGNPTGGNGVAITSAGIGAISPTGKFTFAINANTGEASFAGNLIAAGGTFAGKLTADNINAVSTLNIADEAVSVQDSSSVISPGVAGEGSLLVQMKYPGSITIFCSSEVQGGTIPPNFTCDYALKYLGSSIDSTSGASSVLATRAFLRARVSVPAGDTYFTFSHSSANATIAQVTHKVLIFKAFK